MSGEDGKELNGLDAYYEYENEGLQMREYHNDTLHNNNLIFKPTVSILNLLHVRPLIIVDQDESVFKHIHTRPTVGMIIVESESCCQNWTTILRWCLPSQAEYFVSCVEG